MKMYAIIIKDKFCFAKITKYVMDILKLQIKIWGQKMENYSLQANEVLLYKGEAYNGIEIILTNLNLIIVKKTQKLFKKTEVKTFVYYKDDIKMYNDIPQVKQKESTVEIFLTLEEIKVDFYSRTEAYKFVNAVYELLTGKSTTARGAEKIKSAIRLVDDTLGIDTMDTVKNVVENGIAGSLLGGISKKIGIKNKSSSIKETVGAAKEVIDAAATITSSKTIEKTEDYNEKIESVKKLKELLDAGILTQEEFDEKKKQLLGL